MKTQASFLTPLIPEGNPTIERNARRQLAWSGPILTAALIHVACGPRGEDPATGNAVGYAVIAIPDSSRTFITPSGPVPRPVTLAVWYPAVPHTGRVITYREYIVFPSTGEAAGSEASMARYRTAYQTELGDSVRPGLFDALMGQEVVARAEAQPFNTTSPVLLLETGLNAPGFLYSDLAASLAGKGIIVAALPSFGPAHDRPLSFDTLGVATQLADLEHAMAGIRALPQADSRRVFVGGWSVGALAAAKLAQEMPGSIKGMISLDGAVGYEYGAHLGRLAGLLPSCLSVPLLHITGTRPGRFRVSKSRELYEQLPGGNAFWAAVPGLRHGDFTSYYSTRAPDFANSPDQRSVAAGQRALERIVVAFIRRYGDDLRAAWDSVLTQSAVDELAADPNAPPVPCPQR